MSHPGAPAPAIAEPERPSTFFANLVDLYFAPAQAFASLLRQPAFLTPLAVQLGLSVALWGIWLQKVDMAAFFAAQMEEAGRTASIPADRLQRIEELTRVTYWVASVVAPLIALFVLAGLFLFIYRFFYESEVTFKQSLAIVAASFGAFSLVTTPIFLGVLALKGEWTILPPEAAQANLALLLDKQTTSKALYAFASSLDLFSFWLMFLLASGFAVASRRTWASALPGIVVPWAFVVAIKVVWFALR